MFYDNYLRLCELHNEKPTTVAKKVGCTSSNVALWKKGSTPRMEVLEKIANYFNVSAKVLLFGETDDPQAKENALNFNVEGWNDLQKAAIQFVLSLPPEKLEVFLKMGRAAFEETSHDRLG